MTPRFYQYPAFFNIFSRNNYVYLGFAKGIMELYIEGVKVNYDRVLQIVIFIKTSKPIN